MERPIHTAASRARRASSEEQSAEVQVSRLFAQDARMAWFLLAARRYAAGGMAPDVAQALMRAYDELDKAVHPDTPATP